MVKQANRDAGDFGDSGMSDAVLAMGEDEEENIGEEDEEDMEEEDLDEEDEEGDEDEGNNT